MSSERKHKKFLPLDWTIIPDTFIYCPQKRFQLSFYDIAQNHCQETKTTLSILAVLDSTLLTGSLAHLHSSKLGVMDMKYTELTTYDTSPIAEPQTLLAVMFSIVEI